MTVIVQKFGGTSVASDEVREHAIRHIQEAVDEGHQVVVVVSAMGRKGAPYATDQLMELIGERPACDRDVDMLLACGEAISAVVFSAHLREHGFDAAVFNGAQAGIVTDAQHGDARIREIRTDRMEEVLEVGKIPVVMGFQGVTEDGELTTLGRGGSDTTATALGTALGAERVEIFSDVEGILTADPRVVDQSVLLPQLTYTEACNLAYEGAKVIHPRAVEVAMQKTVPVYVRNTRGDAPGTRICCSDGEVEDRMRLGGCVIGVTHRPDLVQVNISADDEVQRQVYALLAEHGIQPNFTLSSPQQLSFTIAERYAKRVDGYLRTMGHDPGIVYPCARVSVVGTRLDEIPGLMGIVRETLAEAGVQVLQSADAQAVVRALVRKCDMEKAVQALHERLIENKWPPDKGSPVYSDSQVALATAEA